MKKIINIALAVLYSACCAGSLAPFMDCGNHPETRQTTALVAMVEDDRLTVQTEDGHIWEVYADESYSAGAPCRLVFLTQGTETIEDDEIIQIGGA